jgi:murein DD-endopeptidase MepM/ murein hydrolase activator NlpD
MKQERFLFFPVKPWIITQGFGVNPDMYKQFGINGHNGLDIVAGHGQNVYAAHDGVVVYAGLDGNEGVGVVIRTNREVEYAGGKAYMKSIYWHLINNVKVRVGQQVKAGDLIGYADSTGFSTGDHLHFAIKPQAMGENDWTWDNVAQNNGFNGAIDPTPYFSGYYAQDAQVVMSVLRQLTDLMKQLAKAIFG